MTNLAETSVPSWIVDSAPQVMDATGVSYVLVAVGGPAREELRKWHRELTGTPVTILEGEDGYRVSEALAAELGRCRVGVRLRLAGPAGTCLMLRAEALHAGVEDDEISAIALGDEAIGVFCTHCRTVTEAHARIGDEVTCTGCQRALTVYHHVSRLKGQFMGFMADAESQGT